MTHSLVIGFTSGNWERTGGDFKNPKRFTLRLGRVMSAEVVLQQREDRERWGVDINGERLPNFFRTPEAAMLYADWEIVTRFNGMRDPYKNLLKRHIANGRRNGFEGPHALTPGKPGEGCTSVTLKDGRTIYPGDTVTIRVREQ